MRTYEKYKDSGISWLQGQQIPSDWTTCKLKNTAKSKGGLFIDGDWIESKNIIPDSNIIYTTTGNVGPGYFKYQSLGHISEQTFVDLNCTEVKPGDLVISRLNEPIGRACIFPKLGNKMITAVDNVVLRPDKEKYNKKYLMYQMNSPKYTTSANLVARGATMHRISRSMLGDIELLVPPLSEQETIANFLDKKTAEIDKIIAKREKKIELLNELKSSIISRAVTKGINPHAKMKDSGISWLQEQQIPSDWTTCKLKNTAKSKDGLFIDGDWIESKNIIPDSNIIYTTTGNVGPGYFKYQSLGHISEQTFVDLNCTEVKPGDLVISRLNEPIGRACIFPKLGDKMITAVDNVVLRPDKEKYNKKYLMYQMNSPKYTISANLVARGATMHRISRSMLGDIELLVPPLSEQEAIANYLDKKTEEIDKTISDIKKECILYKEYKQSLISEVVTGKRKVID